MSCSGVNSTANTIPIYDIFSYLALCGHVNPYIKIYLFFLIQDCNSKNKLHWSNNNALKCTDGNLCSRNDKCVNGVCRGTSFTCRSCETCDGSGCKIKPGFCVIEGTCYSNNQLRPGKPCQVA